MSNEPAQPSYVHQALSEALNAIADEILNTSRDVTWRTIQPVWRSIKHEAENQHNLATQKRTAEMFA